MALQMQSKAVTPLYETISQRIVAAVAGGLFIVRVHCSTGNQQVIAQLTERLTKDGYEVRHIPESGYPAEEQEHFVIRW